MCQRCQLNMSRDNMVKGVLSMQFRSSYNSFSHVSSQKHKSDPWQHSFDSERAFINSGRFHASKEMCRVELLRIKNIIDTSTRNDCSLSATDINLLSCSPIANTLPSAMRGPDSAQAFSSDEMLMMDDLLRVSFNLLMKTVRRLESTIKVETQEKHSRTTTIEGDGRMHILPDAQGSQNFIGSGKERVCGLLEEKDEVDSQNDTREHLLRLENHYDIVRQMSEDETLSSSLAAVFLPLQIILGGFSLKIAIMNGRPLKTKQDHIKGYASVYQLACVLGALMNVEVFNEHILIYSPAFVTWLQLSKHMLVRLILSIIFQLFKSSISQLMMSLNLYSSSSNHQLEGCTVKNSKFDAISPLLNESHFQYFLTMITMGRTKSLNVLLDASQFEKAEEAHQSCQILFAKGMSKVLYSVQSLLTMLFESTRAPSEQIERVLPTILSALTLSNILENQSRSDAEALVKTRNLHLAEAALRTIVELDLLTIWCPGASFLMPCMKKVCFEYSKLLIPQAAYSEAHVIIWDIFRHLILIDFGFAKEISCPMICYLSSHVGHSHGIQLYSLMLKRALMLDEFPALLEALDYQKQILNSEHDFTFLIHMDVLRVLQSHVAASPFIMVLRLIEAIQTHIERFQKSASTNRESQQLELPAMLMVWISLCLLNARPTQSHNQVLMGLLDQHHGLIRSIFQNHLIELDLKNSKCQAFFYSMIARIHSLQKLESISVIPRNMLLFEQELLRAHRPDRDLLTEQSTLELQEGSFGDRALIKDASVCESTLEANYSKAHSDYAKVSDQLLLACRFVIKKFYRATRTTTGSSTLPQSISLCKWIIDMLYQINVMNLRLCHGILRRHQSSQKAKAIRSLQQSLKALQWHFNESKSIWQEFSQQAFHSSEHYEALPGTETIACISTELALGSVCRSAELSLGEYVGKQARPRRLAKAIDKLRGHGIKNMRFTLSLSLILLDSIKNQIKTGIELLLTNRSPGNSLDFECKCIFQTLRSLMAHARLDPRWFIAEVENPSSRVMRWLLEKKWTKAVSSRTELLARLCIMKHLLEENSLCSSRLRLGPAVLGLIELGVEMLHERSPFEDVRFTWLFARCVSEKIIPEILREVQLRVSAASLRKLLHSCTVHFQNFRKSSSSTCAYYGSPSASVLTRSHPTHCSPLFLTNARSSATIPALRFAARGRRNMSECLAMIEDIAQLSAQFIVLIGELDLLIEWLQATCSFLKVVKSSRCITVKLDLSCGSKSRKLDESMKLGFSAANGLRSFVTNDYVPLIILNSVIESSRLTSDWLTIVWPNILCESDALSRIANKTMHTDSNLDGYSQHHNSDSSKLGISQANDNIGSISGIDEKCKPEGLQSSFDNLRCLSICLQMILKTADSFMDANICQIVSFCNLLANAPRLEEYMSLSTQIILTMKRLTCLERFRKPADYNHYASICNACERLDTTTKDTITGSTPGFCTDHSGIICAALRNRKHDGLTCLSAIQRIRDRCFSNTLSIVFERFQSDILNQAEECTSSMASWQWIKKMSLSHQATDLHSVFFENCEFDGVSHQIASALKYFDLDLVQLMRQIRSSMIDDVLRIVCFVEVCSCINFNAVIKASQDSPPVLTESCSQQSNKHSQRSPSQASSSLSEFTLLMKALLLFSQYRVFKELQLQEFTRSCLNSSHGESDKINALHSLCTIGTVMLKLSFVVFGFHGLFTKNVSLQASLPPDNFLLGDMLMVAQSIARLLYQLSIPAHDAAEVLPRTAHQLMEHLMNCCILQLNSFFYCLTIGMHGRSRRNSALEATFKDAMHKADALLQQIWRYCTKALKNLPAKHSAQLSHYIGQWTQAVYGRAVNESTVKCQFAFQQLAESLQILKHGISIPGDSSAHYSHEHKFIDSLTLLLIKHRKIEEFERTLESADLQLYLPLKSDLLARLNACRVY